MDTSPVYGVSNVELDAFRLLDKLVRETSQPERADKATLQAMIEGSICSAAEKAAMVRFLDRVHGDDTGRVTLKEWDEFVHLYEEEVMRRGHVNNILHRILLLVDFFRIGAWHDFVYYKQVTFFGAAVTVALMAAFLITMVFSILSFIRDENTIIQQTFLQNEYAATSVGSFFFFFRTASWANILDSSLFTFEMSYYIKRVNATSGEVIEEYTSVPARNVTKSDFSWWPDSIGADTIAVSPSEPITLEGAYHLDHFKQLEVKLVPCRNSTGADAVVCKSPEEIREALHGGSVNFVVRSTEHGYVTARTAYWTAIVGETKQVDLWFDSHRLQTTAKYPFKPDLVEHFMPFAGSTQQIAPMWYDQSLAVWWFTQSDESLTELRKREAATDLIATWGGTWASLFSMGGVAAHWYNKRRLDSQIGLLRKRSRLVEDLRITSQLSQKWPGTEETV